MELMAYYGWQPMALRTAERGDINRLRERADKKLSLFDVNDQTQYQGDYGWGEQHTKRYKREWWANKKSKRQEKIAELVVRVEAYLGRVESASVEAIANRLKEPKVLVKHAVQKVPNIKRLRPYEKGKRISMWSLK